MGMSCAAVRIRCRRGRSSWVEALWPDRPRPSRPSWRSPDGGRNGPAPGAKRRAGAPAEDGEARLFCFAMQRPAAGVPTRQVAWGGQGRRKIAGRSHCRAGPPAVRSPSRRPGARLCPASWAKPDRLRGHRRADVQPVSAVAHSMKRTTSCGASWVRRAARRSSMPKVRRSSLKSPSLGDHAIASMPAASARSVRAVTAASPAASASRAM